MTLESHEQGGARESYSLCESLENYYKDKS